MKQGGERQEPVSYNATAEAGYLKQGSLMMKSMWKSIWEKKNKDWLVWLQRQTEPLRVTVMGARPPRNRVTVWNKAFKDGWQQNLAYILLGPFLRSTSILKTFRIVALLQSPNLSVSYITISNF